MKICIVRHAKAEKQSDWDASDRLRPLTPRGLRQSRALAAVMAETGLTRIVSSPHLRCIQTVEPLAAASGLPIELDERIADRESPEKAFELIEEMNNGTSVLCSHGGVILGLLAELEDHGAQLRIDGRFRCQKGSIWEVEKQRGKARQVTYRPPPRPERKQKKMAADRERIAVLDLGSTSFRVVLFDATRAGKLDPVANERKMLRLGAAIADDAHIPKATCDEAVAAATRLCELAREAGADRVLPVATAALRDAANGPALAARIGESLGTEVRVVSGEEEARLLFRAFQRRIVLPSEPALGIDLGGGSLELVIGDAQEIHWEATLPIGVTRLHREIVENDPMRKREVRRIRERLQEAVEPHRAAIEKLGPTTLIAAGGTARAFSYLAHTRRGETSVPPIGPSEITLHELDKLTRQLLRANHDERIAMDGVRKERADLLPTGGILLTTLAELLGVECYTVCDWGLREGVVLDALDTD